MWVKFAPHGESVLSERHSYAAGFVEGAERMIRDAVAAFGDLHVLVNNAGILRDRVLVNMTIEEWDAVIKVNLRGHFCPTHAAAAYWRERSKWALH